MWDDLNNEVRENHIKLDGLFSKMKDIDWPLKGHIIDLLHEMSQSKDPSLRPTASDVAARLRSFSIFKPNESGLVSDDKTDVALANLSK